MNKEAVIIIVIALSLLVLTFLTNTSGFPNFLDESLPSGGLGDLCSSQENCNSFCHKSRGQCENFCEANPETQYCNILYSNPPR